MKTEYLLYLLPILFIMPILANAQQYSHYGGLGSDLPQTTNQDVLSRILDALDSFFEKIITMGNNQDSDLKQIIKNQQQEINLLQQMVNKK